MRRLIVSVVSALACSGGESPGTHNASADSLVPVRAVWPGVVLVEEDDTLSRVLVENLGKCQLRFHLEAGMTNRGANDAIDAGYQRFLTCLRTKGRLVETTES